ncbi:MAG TPA: DEAD/DEAH box helicase, partial [Verrucomicrobiae bacterium]|nr:DEAD/DEAH box helicase [Verrucomicrobiae bacterium]
MTCDTLTASVLRLPQNAPASATSDLLADVSNVPAVQSVARRVEQGGALPCSGIAASAQPFFSALLSKFFPGRPIIIVTDNLKTQEGFQQDLETWLGSSPLFYPPWEILPHEGKLPHADTISDRLQALITLAQKPAGRESQSTIVVTSVAALLQKTFSQGDLKERTRRFARGDGAEPVDLIDWLETQGYDAEAQVTQRGEIAMRGGIVDVYPPTSPWPVRLEFFGNELESLRYFDPLTQISREEIVEVTIPPAGELGVLKHELENAASGQVPMATLLEFLPRESILLLCEPEQLALRAEEYEASIPANDPFLISWADFQKAAGQKQISIISLTEAEEYQADPIGLQFQGLEGFRPLAERAPDPQVAEVQRREFFQQLHRWLRQNYSLHVFCNNDGEKQRFEEIWKEHGFSEEKKLTVQIGNLSRGFLSNEARLVVITDAEIFGRYKIQRPRKLKSPHAIAMRSALEIDFADLEEGDLVVHLQHGIGRYLGLKNMPVGLGTKPREGVTTTNPPPETECLVIEFATSDSSDVSPKLYVPVSEAHLVSKYVGAGKARPPLNALGGTRWHKAKETAERAVRDVAAELLRIQAVRESQAGHAFNSDVPWQREFESAFIYEETPDQMKAINDTKGDMERPKPMDRLICGDVGFGKTEVAIRAAFKAVMGGKQVAILVPTTVLAQQHFNNFRERMADYPIRIELLSRFRTRREQDAVVKNLAAGTVDIVIGTHRLVQEDIAFKELGLVV